MSTPQKPGVGQREFLGVAAGEAAALAPHPDAHAADHDHARGNVPSDVALRVKSLESLLVAKGLVDPQVIDTVVDHYANRVGPRNGATLVAKAWTDPQFKKRLLEDGTGVLASMRWTGWGQQRLVVVENGPAVHNVLVCTLCSCYPISTLGVPPAWYKSHAYRSRMVIDPRGTLKELGLDLPEHFEVRVWDANSEQLFMVMPERPANSAGMSEEQLANLVTRDGMIGVARL